MDKFVRPAALLIIGVSLASIFLAGLANHGMWWDEAVYLGLGRGIQNGFYSLDEEALLETFRPAVFPFLISPLSGNAASARILVALLSVVAVVSLYYLSRELFGKDVALFSALFLSTGQMLVFFGAKILSESLFISLICLSLIFFLRRGRPYCALLSGALAGAAFMTRYLGTIMIISYALWFVYAFAKKGDAKPLREAALMLAGFVASISPWLAMNQYYYGNVLGAYLQNLEVYSASIASGASSYLADVYGVFGLQIIFLAFGLFVLLKYVRSEYRFLLLSLFILPLVFFSAAFHREPRYLLSYMPVYAMFCALFVKFKSRRPARYARFLPLAALLVCVLSMFTGLSMVWNDRFSGSALVDASLYLGEVTSVGGEVMTESYPYVYYFSGRRAVRFPQTPEEIGGLIENSGVEFVMVYKFEPGNPGYAAEYFENSPDFEYIKSFEQWGDPEAVRIYRVL